MQYKEKKKTEDSVTQNEKTRVHWKKLRPRATFESVKKITNVEKVDTTNRTIETRKRRQDGKSNPGKGNTVGIKCSL